MSDSSNPPGPGPGPLPGKRWHTREDSGIRLDADGAWWHDDERVEHPRIIEAFNQSLQPTDDGRFKLVIGSDWCFVQVDGPAYRVLAVHETTDDEGEPILMLALSDRTQEALDPETLVTTQLGTAAAAGEAVLHCRVKERRALARLSRDAQFQLGELLEDDGNGGLVLRLGRRSFPIREA